MKKLVVLAVLLAAVAGFAAAGGLDFHLGAGYHSSYFSDSVTVPSGNPSSYPLGVGAYGGIGYGFGERKMLNLGVEFAPYWDLGLTPVAVSNFAYQARAYLKLKPAGMLTVTGFGGYVGNAFPSDWGFDTNEWAFGARVTILFLYAEYAAVFTNDLDGIVQNQIGIGFALFK